MVSEADIVNYHHKIRYQQRPIPLKELSLHHIVTVNNKNRNKTSLKIRAFHFSLLSIYRFERSDAMVIDDIGKWVEISEVDFYYKKELKEFAMQCLYLLNMPLGECVVERMGVKEIAVVSATPLQVDQLAAKEKSIIRKKIELEEIGYLTFGSDLELMLFNNITNKYINGQSLLKEGQIGYDDAIAVNKNRVFHPIIEIRPKPASTMSDLHKNLEKLYDSVIEQTKQLGLEVVTNANPISRFFLGGHIHFGQLLPTFQHVRLLDHYVTIPFSMMEQGVSFKRRRTYGRLGSIRENHFQGFEYRVLPSWFSYVPKILPLLQWIEYLMKNASAMKIPTWQKSILINYYNGGNNTLDSSAWLAAHEQYLSSEEQYYLFKNYLSCLKKLY